MVGGRVGLRGCVCDDGRRVEWVFGCVLNVREIGYGAGGGLCVCAGDDGEKNLECQRLMRCCRCMLQFVTLRALIGRYGQWRCRFFSSALAAALELETAHTAPRVLRAFNAPPPNLGCHRWRHPAPRPDGQSEIGAELCTTSNFCLAGTNHQPPATKRAEQPLNCQLPAC